jgi:hypothetical protein
MDQDHGKDQPNGPPSASGSPGSANGLVTGAMGATEDEQLLNRPMPSEPVPRSAELGAFTHTDPWRVLRIQGEFVYGINALAEVGAAVAVFGSARFGESHPMYDHVRQVFRRVRDLPGGIRYAG